jgi:hypothetical protein
MGTLLVNYLQVQLLFMMMIKCKINQLFSCSLVQLQLKLLLFMAEGLWLKCYFR